LDNFLKVHGNVLWVAQEASGWIRFAMIRTSSPLIYGDVLSIPWSVKKKLFVEVILE